MSIIGSIVVCVLLAFGALCALGNWIALATNIRNARRGIDRHVSPIPLLAQFFPAAAAMLADKLHGVDWIPGLVYWLVALLDPGLWLLACSRSWRRGGPSGRAVAIRAERTCCTPRGAGHPAQRTDRGAQEVRRDVGFELVMHREGYVRGCPDQAVVPSDVAPG